MVIQESEVVKQYQVLPAIEQTKIMIIKQLTLLFDTVNILLQQRILGGGKDEEVISLVKATTLSLYMILKPKIREHILTREQFAQGSEQTSIELMKELSNLDESLRQPTKFTIEDALKYSDLINLFCHEYGITKITYFAGTERRDRDISNF